MSTGTRLHNMYDSFIIRIIPKAKTLEFYLSFICASYNSFDAPCVFGAIEFQLSVV